MKRFYQLVSVSPLESGYGIFLDGKPVKTPAKNLLVCANEKIAAHAMQEWAEQLENILPDAMPVNQLLITSLDSLRDRAEIEKHILDYIDTDLICYRSDETPYKEQQADKWGKWTDWFEKTYSASVKTTESIAPLAQNETVHRVFKDHVRTLDPLSLLVFESLVDETSSPLLALAFFEGVANAQDLYAAVLVEDLIKAEIYDENKYGAAPDQEKKRIKIRAVLDAADKILNAVK